MSHSHLVRCEVNPAVRRGGQLKEAFPCVVGWRLSNVGDQAVHSTIRAYLRRAKNTRDKKLTWHMGADRRAKR